MKTKTDKQGAPYHMHRLDGTPRPEYVPPPKPAGAEVQRADADSLHSVYSALLASLSLMPAHRDSLQRRGLTDAEIDRRGYRSLPVKGRVRIAGELRERFGDAVLSVPGVIIKEKNDRRYVTLAGAAGLLIPVRDTVGRIVALKIRRDDGDGGNRYCYLSSKNFGGAGPGSPVHVPLGIQTPTEVVRLTEGELKADVALALSGLPTISIAGVGNWRLAVDTLKSLGCTTVRLSFDADAATKTHVARTLRDCAAGHAAEGFTLELERWPVEHKGIDDALVSGVVPEVLIGVAAVAAIRAIADAAGVKGNVIDRLGQSLADGGSAALFRDRELLRALALLSIDDPAEFACCRSVAQRHKVRLRDLDKALAPCRAEIMRARPPADSAVQYQIVGGRIVREVLTRDGAVGVPLCNFAARIVERIIVDDGAERTTRLAVEGQLADGTPLARAEINADDFAWMRWPLAQWGTRAVVYAGVGTADHLRAALQLLSGDVPTRTVFAHLGWRQIGDKWFYLHANGAIGPDDSASDISVSPPDALAGYILPAPLTGKALAAAVRASLGLLDGLAPDRIAFPVLTAGYRAVLGGTDFGLHLAGPTGVFKSELAAIAQQHFGSGLDARHLPASWASTVNALEGLAFAAKDALLVVDDFAPTGSTSDVQRMHREADRLLRAQGNGSGRQRMRADATLRSAKPPRGLIFSTGEDIPRGQSLRARLWSLEVGPGDVAVSRLTAAQADAAAGKFAAALAGFIRWLSPQYAAVRDRLRTESAELRSLALSSGQHRHARTPDITASLALGLRYLLAYAIEVGAITKAESAALWVRGWAALGDAAAAQADHVAAAEPTAHFLRLMSGVIASGRAHLAGPDGCAPANAPAWGWRHETVGAEQYGRGEWQPQGRRIGWIDGEAVYLEPEAAYAEAQELARHQGDAMPVGPRSLWRRMRERGLLAETDKARETNTVRRTLDGCRRDVIYLRPGAVNTHTEPGQPDQSAAIADKSGQFGDRVDPDPTTNPTTDPTTKSMGNVQLVGLVGSETGIDGLEGGKSVNTVCRYPNHHRRWRSIHGVVLCGICVPPISDKVVAEWLDGPPLEKSGER